MTDNEMTERFLDILEKNIGIIVKISRAYANLKQDREDLMNDITLELWKSFKSFKGNSSISTWIYRVALNTSMNYKRKRRKDPLYTSSDELVEKRAILLYSEQDDTPELEVLYNCIDELNAINKAIVLLYLDENSHEEIAEIMGMSKTNVGTRISRIKDQLKNLATSKR